MLKNKRESSLKKKKKKGVLKKEQNPCVCAQTSPIPLHTEQSAAEGRGRYSHNCPKKIARGHQSVPWALSSEVQN